MQIWLVRILAVTALLFMPQIVFFAYLIAVFVVPTKDQVMRSREETIDDEVEQHRERQSRFDDELTASEESSLNTKRRRVRQFRERFEKLDKRMRDLESYITSSQFELNKEFRKI